MIKKRLFKIGICVLIVTLALLVINDFFVIDDVPLNYDGTCWKSEDGTIYFEVADNYGKGYIHIGDEKNDIDIGSIRDILRVSEYVANEEFPKQDFWRVVAFSKDKFVIANNNEGDGLFTLGERVTFYRVDTPSQTE